MWISCATPSAAPPWPTPICSPRTSWGPPNTWATVLLRGSNDLVLAEASRSLHDAQCVVRSLVKKRFLLAGGGAPETQAALELSKFTHNNHNRDDPASTTESSTDDAESNQIMAMDAHCIKAFAEALEVIPYTLAENAGMKPIEVVTELRKRHTQGETGAGINVKKSCVSDMYQLNVIQPLLVSTSAVQLATETVCMILKVDDLIVVA